jgi:hypothetical protein
MTFLLHNAGFAHMQNETFSWNNGNGIQTALGVRTQLLKWLVTEIIISR